MGLLSRMLGKKRDPEKARGLVETGLSAAKEGRLDAALRLYIKAVKADPEDALAKTNVGIALLDLYNQRREELDAEEARERLLAIEETLVAATALEGATVVAFRALGHCRLRLHHYAGAAESFGASVAMLTEEDVQREVLLELREEAKRMARRDAAVERAARAAAFDDVDEEERTGAAQDLVEVLVNGDAPADAYWAAGALARLAGNADASQGHYETCLEMEPYHDRARRELATLCMNTGDIDAALEHSLHAYQADPTDGGRVCNVGVCHLALGNRAKAIEFLTLALELAPDDDIVQRAHAKLSESEAP